MAGGQPEGRDRKGRSGHSLTRRKEELQATVKTLTLSVASQKADGGKSKVSPSSSGSMATERRDGSDGKTPSEGERAGTAAPVEPVPNSGETRGASQSTSKGQNKTSSQPSVRCFLPSTTCRRLQT